MEFKDVFDVGLGGHSTGSGIGIRVEDFDHFFGGVKGIVEDE